MLVPDRFGDLDGVVGSAEAQAGLLQKGLGRLMEVVRGEGLGFDQAPIREVKGQSVAQDQGMAIGDLTAGLTAQGFLRQLALDWLALPQPRPILLLEGDLGAGKTSLVQGIALALEIEEPITSPTFALAQHYQGQAAALVHLDLYRLEQSASADELFCQEEEEADRKSVV